MKTIDDYVGILPYASELFGIYQPILGWKSQIVLKRYERIRSKLYNDIAARSLMSARAPVQIKLRDIGANVPGSGLTRLSFKASQLAPLNLDRTSETHIAATINSGIARLTLRELDAE